jgi:putative Holliday junction resolvase
MPRVLAIDYGTKRVGLAVTDPQKIIASRLETVHSKDVIEFLKKYCLAEEVESFVVGLPLNLDGKATDATPHVEAFVKKLKKQFPLVPIHRMDERFTSKIAFQTMIDAGLKKKDRQRKDLVDGVSATLILQNYLESTT